MAGAVAFYPARMDRCLVDGEVVRPQAGGFYGGWITDDVVGPFKGEPGTMPLVTCVRRSDDDRAARRASPCA